jgi:YbgC/YbaW family acyl-CoA thioester hydrolase
MKLEDLKLTTKEEVMFFDTDCGGVVHNIAYLRMIETCRTKLAGLMGMDLQRMSETQLFPVVFRTEIDYRQPAKLGDVLKIHGHVSEIGKVKFWCDFKVVREGEEQSLITCRQGLAMVQMPQGQPRRLLFDWT